VGGIVYESLRNNIGENFIEDNFPKSRTTEWSKKCRFPDLRSKQQLNSGTQAALIGENHFEIRALWILPLQSAFFD
jgi:hypothetical protein